LIYNETITIANVMLYIAPICWFISCPLASWGHLHGGSSIKLKGIRVQKKLLKRNMTFKSKFYKNLYKFNILEVPTITLIVICVIFASLFKVDGLHIDKYDDGMKKIEYTIKNGAKNGKYTQWYKNGQIKEKSYYLNGKHNDEGTGFHENGNMKFRSNFINGAPEGIATVWHENGQKKLEYTSVNGKKHGKLIEWDKSGKKIKEEVWKDGEKQ
jgi:hypothetical protein